MIRALIVDDEPLSRRAVRQMCARHADVSVVAECRNGVEAAVALRSTDADVVFLDVKMPGLSGLDVARRRRDSVLPLIVYVTGYDQYALPAFDTAPIDYLTKPLNAARFDVALDRVRAHLGRAAAAAKIPGSPAEKASYLIQLVARFRDRDIVIPVESVELIAADDVYAAVHSLAGVHLVRQPLDVLAEQLDPSRFVRVHRSFIVHVDYVVAVKRDSRGGKRLLMRSGAEVPVSRRRKAALDLMRSR